jgi:hypothetical protein
MLQMESIEQAWAEYVAQSAAQDLYDLQELATRYPAETWSFLRDQIHTDLPDEFLAMLAIEIVDVLHIYGDVELWQTIEASATSNPSIARMLAALDRYHAEEAVLDNLLRLVPQAAPSFEPEDLPIPNPFDRRSLQSDLEAFLSEESKLAFLAHEHEGWEDVQWLCDVAPESAFKVGLELLAAATPDEVSHVGIALFEDLITWNETLLAEHILEAVRSNARFREALASCYLNASEPFLHRLIGAVHEAMTRAPNLSL